MILLEDNVPQVYVEESRDFQYILKIYNTIFNMLKYETDTLQYITDTDQIESSLLPLLKSKIGFFTDYPINDKMLRGILSGFPLMVKNKGSLESIQQALNIFLKVLNIRTQIVLKAVGEDAQLVDGVIQVDSHTILIAIQSAVQSIYILEELFRYIMPAGFQYSFYFYRNLEQDDWLLDENKGRFLIVNNLVNDSIRYESFQNQDYDNRYADPEVNKMVNQVNTSSLVEQTKFKSDGPNLLTGKSWTNGSYYNDSGAITTSQGTKRMASYIPVTPLHPYKIVMEDNPDIRIRVHEYDSSKQWLRQIYREYGESAQWQASSDAAFIRLSLGLTASSIVLSEYG